MSNAKGSGKDNKLTQPRKVTAQSQSEVKDVSIQDYRKIVQKAVAMPAAAVRAAMATTIAGAAAAKVAYDVLSRLLNLVESGIVIDKALLKTTKAALDTAHVGDAILKRDIGKLHAQIVTLNDVLTRVASFYRTRTEIARATDLPAKTLTKAPRQDTARGADTRIKAFTKGRTESITLGENFSKVVSFSRTLTETARSSDNDTIFFTKRRTDIARSTDAKSATLAKPKSETVSLTELKKLNLGKFLTEISRASDSDKITFTKRVSDFVSAIHSAHTDLGFTNSEVNLSTVSDTLTKLVSFVRSYNDTSRAADTLKRTVSKPRSERIVSSDIVTRLVSFGRSRPETARATDVFTRVISFNRTRTDTARGTDLSAKFLTKSPFTDTSRSVDIAKRTIGKRSSDTARSADAFSRLVSFNRAFNASINAISTIDVISTVKQFNRVRTDTARSTDNFTKVVTFRRLPAELPRATDVFTRVVTFRRLPAELPRATDLFRRTVSYNRTRSDTSRASDVFVKTVTYRRLPADTARGIDLITAKIITKRLSDLIRVSDDGRVTYHNKPGTYPPADAAKLRDVFTKLVSFIRNFTDVARATDTKKFTTFKPAGSLFEIWTDYQDEDITQNLTPYRVEILQPVDAVGKFYSKVANKTATYYYNAYPITDFNELTFGESVSVVNDDPPFATQAQFDQDQFFTYTDSYQADTERALISDAITKVAQFVRLPADTSSASDSVGRYIARTVGDIKSKVFNDFAELFYVSETYSNLGGVNGIVSVVNNYPTFTVTIVNGGSNYTVGQPFTLIVNGAECSFSVATVDGSGKILTITTPTGTPARLPLNVSYFTDYAELTLGTGVLDQELAQYNALTYTLPGPDTIRVGPQPFETKRNVWNQDLLFTLTERADGDKVSYTDSSSKTITKDARRYLPQGVFEDFAELTFGLGPFDQELSQYLNKLWPESVSVIDISSRVTLGPTKKNTSFARATDVDTVSVSKPRTEIARVADGIRSATTGLVYSRSAGEWANRTWRDYDELSPFAFSALAEMPIDYEGRYELIIIPDTIGKSIVKPLHFERYVWRDFNELSFGSTRDEELVLQWFTDDQSDIVRFMDNSNIQFGKRNTEVLNVPETFEKGFSRQVGNTILNDALASNPEYIPYFSWFDELLQPQYPDYKIDRATVPDTTGRTISKIILGPGPYTTYFSTDSDTTSFDETTVTIGYTGQANNGYPDTKFVSYFDELVNTEFEEVYRTPYGSDSASVVEFFSRLVTFRRTFVDTVRASDYFLLSKNGEAQTNEYLPVINKTARAADDIIGMFVTKLVGDVKSAISVWSDYNELLYDYELAQYYDDPDGSRIDVSRTADLATRQFNKRGGNVYTIWNTLDEDLYYTQDLSQTYATDYVTELVFSSDFAPKTIGPNKYEVIQPVDIVGKSFEKNGIGDSIVDDWLLYSPLYLDYFSDLEERLRAQYPPRKTDIARGTDVRTNLITKSAGNSPVLKWYTNFEYLSNDETNVTEGVYENRENDFAQTVYRNYLESLIFGDVLEDFFETSIRSENLLLGEVFFRRTTSIRTFNDIAKISDPIGKELSKPAGVDVARSQDTSNRYTEKPAGSKFWVWRDYNELVVDQDLNQYYDSIRLEYLVFFDLPAKLFSKGVTADTTRAVETFVKRPTKGLSETPLAQELVGKAFSKASVGDSSVTQYFDTNEILSFDETLFSYGVTRTFSTDIARPADTLAKAYTVKPGNYRTNIWNDYLDLQFDRELANYWPPYVTEIIVPRDIATKSLNKGKPELIRSSDSGFARKFDSNAYVIDSSPYFATDYVSDGVTTSTF